MYSLKIVFSEICKICDENGVILNTGKLFFQQGSLYETFTILDNGFVVPVDENNYFIPIDMGVIVDPELHPLGSSDVSKDAYDKHCRNVSDYTKAYLAFGKDRSLDYSVQINKNLQIDEQSADDNKVPR